MLERDIACFGLLLFELLTAAELTAQELSNWQAAVARNARFPGPSQAWALLRRIFLPDADVVRGPTLLELLADPYFSVALPPHTAPHTAPPAAPHAANTPPELGPACAAMLAAACGRCDDLVFVDGARVLVPGVGS